MILRPPIPTRTDPLFPYTPLFRERNFPMSDTPRMIFVNLPVADLEKSKAFYEAIGFTNEPRFTDETAAAMVWSEQIFVMILHNNKWNSFTDRTNTAIGSRVVSLPLAMGSKETVDAIDEAQ